MGIRKLAKRSTACGRHWTPSVDPSIHSPLTHPSDCHCHGGRRAANLYSVERCILLDWSTSLHSPPSKILQHVYPSKSTIQYVGSDLTRHLVSDGLSFFPPPPPRFSITLKNVDCPTIISELLKARPSGLFKL